MHGFNTALFLQATTIGSLLTPFLLAIGRWILGHRNKSVEEVKTVQHMTMTLATGLETRLVSLTKELADSEARERELQVDLNDANNAVHFYQELLRLNNVALPRATEDTRHRNLTGEASSV